MNPSREEEQSITGQEAIRKDLLTRFLFAEVLMLRCRDIDNPELVLEAPVRSSGARGEPSRSELYLPWTERERDDDTKVRHCRRFKHFEDTQVVCKPSPLLYIYIVEFAIPSGVTPLTQGKLEGRHPMLQDNRE